MGPAQGTQPHSSEKEEEHKQEQEHMERHMDPHGVKLGECEDY